MPKRQLIKSKQMPEKSIVFGHLTEKQRVLLCYIEICYYIRLELYYKLRQIQGHP